MNLFKCTGVQASSIHADFSNQFVFNSVRVLEPFAINGAINTQYWSNPGSQNWKYSDIDAGDISGFVLCSVVGTNADGTSGGQITASAISFNSETGLFSLNFNSSSMAKIFIVMYYNQ